MTVLNSNSTDYRVNDLRVKGPFNIMQRIATPDVSGETWNYGTILVYDYASAVLTSSETETYVLTNGMTLIVKVDGGAEQTATFNTGDFSDIGAATAAEVFAVLNTDIAGQTASASGGAVVMTSDTTGRESSLEVVGGTANAVLGFSTAKTLAPGSMEVSKWDGTDGTTDEICGVLAESMEFDGTNTSILKIETCGTLNAARILPTEATVATAGGNAGVAEKALERLGIFLAGERA